MTTIESSLDFDIAKKAKEIEQEAINKYNTLNDFLNNKKIIYYIDQYISINSFVYYKIYSIEKEENKPYYTYWIGGGFSWKKYFPTENVGKLDINYLYSDKKKCREKICIYYENVVELQEKLTALGITTKIITENFEVSENKDSKINNDKQIIYNNLIFTFYEKGKLFTPIGCKIKLIIESNNKMQTGGGIQSLSKRKTNSNTLSIYNRPKFKSSTKPTRENVILLKPNKVGDILNEEYKKNICDSDITILDITFNQCSEKIIYKYRLYYIVKPQPISSFKKHASLNIYDRKKIKFLETVPNINYMNADGLITYTYLSNDDTSANFKLNINKKRQELYIKGKTSKKIFELYSMIINKYNAVHPAKSPYRNPFFIEEIEHLIINYENNNKDLEFFLKYIDKYIIYLFRPYINYFITKINKDLFEKYGVILFVAGGDAMRRYENDISETKDIDTKLYIGGINDPTKSDSEIKQDIIDTIAKHIVKLKFYLEKNIGTIFNKTEIFSINNLFKVNLIKIENHQHFRVREIRKSSNFPVDLYSLDMRTQLIINKTNKIYNHDISLLDVVLEEAKFDNLYYNIASDNKIDKNKVNYNSENYTNIPIASLDFLISDLTNTYNTPDRALARISSGKVKKDIERYRKLSYLYSRYKQYKTDIFDRSQYNKDIETAAINYLDENSKIGIKLNKIIEKIINGEDFDVDDIIVCNSIMEDEATFVSLPLKIKKIIKKQANIKSGNSANFYNEKLNNIPTISDTNYDVDNDNIYLKTFLKLVSRTGNSELKNKLSFSEKQNEKIYNKYVTKTAQKRKRASKSLSPSSMAPPSPKSVRAAPKSARPATKSARPATKSARTATKSARPATKSARTATKSARPATKSASTAPNSASPDTKRKKIQNEERRSRLSARNGVSQSSQIIVPGDLLR